MTMNDISKIQHSYTNCSADLMDQMINQTTDILSEKAEPSHSTETVDGQENFAITLAEINAMNSNIPTPKSKPNQNLIPMALLLTQTINGVITNRPLLALCESGSSHKMFNKRALPLAQILSKHHQSEQPPLRVHTIVMKQWFFQIYLFPSCQWLENHQSFCISF